MKLLQGSDLAGFIKERQAHQVRGLVQAEQITPKLAIVVTVEHPAIEVYMRMKHRYGDDLGIAVDIHRVAQAEAPALIEQLNADSSVHGIIVQLPLAEPNQTDDIVNLVAPEKDVDALGVNATYEPATALAIVWLLAGYNIELTNKEIVLVGRGKLVGAPLERMLQSMGLEPVVVDRSTKDIPAVTRQADIVVTATGKPGIITPDMLKAGAIVVDAGVAGEDGKTVGDLAEAVYERDDLTITPQKGGVGPLTVCTLFDNVIRAARAQANAKTAA